MVMKFFSYEETIKNVQIAAICFFFYKRLNVAIYFFHQPFGSGGSSANPD